MGTAQLYCQQLQFDFQPLPLPLNLTRFHDPKKNSEYYLEKDPNIYIYMYMIIIYVCVPICFISSPQLPSSTSINFHHPSFCKVVSTACRTASTMASATSTAASLATAMATTTGRTEPSCGLEIRRPRSAEVAVDHFMDGEEGKKKKGWMISQISRSLLIFFAPNKILKMEACEV